MNKSLLDPEGNATMSLQAEAREPYTERLALTQQTPFTEARRPDRSRVTSSWLLQGKSKCSRTHLVNC